MTRRAYLDWLRGVAVLIMVEAHLFDAWVHASDRAEAPYRWAMMLGGFSAPLFLFLAGVVMALAIGSRVRNGLTPEQAAALALRRAWQVIGLAFLFRLQSFIISGGPFPQTLLKVDILNVMGISMLMAAVVWGVFKRDDWRAVVLATLSMCVVFATPVVRSASFADRLPYPLRWYVVSVPGSGAFTLFPWVAFLLVGVAVGVWLDHARSEAEERRAIAVMAIGGSFITLIGFLATYLPPIYPNTTFWSGSPTYFFVRLGILVLAVPVAYAWNLQSRGRSPLREFGVASLFVYWVHVEMVYGVVSIWIHKTLTFGQAVLAYAALSVFLYGLVILKDRFVQRAAPSDPGGLATSPTGRGTWLGEPRPRSN